MVRKVFLVRLITVLAFLCIKPAQVFASGDLVVQQHNDVMYVTTQPSSGNSTNSSLVTSTYTSTDNAVLGAPITAQPGYATNFGALINFLLRLVLVVGAILVFAYLIFGGFQYITSGGEKTKTEAARNRIVAAIIGLLILAASWAVLTLVIRFLGFKDLNDVINNAGTINET